MKKGFLHTLLFLIPLAVFNTVFFMVGGTDHNTSVWISYGFIHLAYVMLAVSPYLAPKGTNALVLGMPLAYVSTIYFYVQFAVGILFILIGMENYKPALIVQIIILGVYATALVSLMLANEYTASNLNRRQEEVAYIKTAANKVKLVMDKLSDKNANKQIERVYYLIHSSPVRSSSTVKALEREVLAQADELQAAVYRNDIAAVLMHCNNITSLMERRNVM